MVPWVRPAAGLSGGEHVHAGGWVRGDCPWGGAGRRASADRSTADHAWASHARLGDERHVGGKGRGGGGCADDTAGVQKMLTHPQT